MDLGALPAGVTLEEWRRAVALTAAATVNAENITTSAITRENNVLSAAHKFERYLRDGS